VRASKRLMSGHDKPIAGHLQQIDTIGIPAFGLR
jgi:hypothetical protein